MHGKEIKRVRSEKSLTQTQLAELCQKEDLTIKQYHIARWENGIANPSIKKMKVIAIALGCEWKLNKLK